MKTTVFFLLVASVTSVLFSNRSVADDSAFADDFHNVNGFYSTNTNGSYVDDQERSREIHSYMSDSVTGDMQISVREDAKTKGADGKPGVLAFAFERVADSCDYCGFTYQGRTDDPIKIPLKGKVTEETLDKIQVSFKHKAVNKNPEHVGLTVSARIECTVDDPYASRVDFGHLKSTGKWQTFSITLDKGTNKVEFLKVVNALSDPTYKLAWSQTGGPDSYQGGDTLLIDDMKIMVLE